MGAAFRITEGGVIGGRCVILPATTVGGDLRPRLAFPLRLHR